VDEREGAGLEASGESDEHYYDVDAAQSDYDLPDTGGESCLQAIVDSDSSQTVKFYWKVSSEQSHDYLQFYIDSTLKDQISGEVGWTQKSYSVTSGIHILKWRYVKDGSGQSGSDCGWVDFVQWTGPSPDQDPANWQEIAYKQDVAGRRVEKAVDGYSTRYVYDGDHVIAEYDGNNNLLRKYIYGPCTDEPISMIEVADSNATYYYHFDALGSVVALSDSAGDTVQTYEYSVYGEVAVQDPNHTNPYMFAGVRYDIEIGLYYNRARYYNPFTGRFLQTDPIADGMNLYAYCGNDPLSLADPSGLSARFLTLEERVAICEDYRNKMVFADVNGGEITVLWDGNSIEGWIDWAPGHFGKDWAKTQAGWTLAGQGEGESQEWWFWRIKALMFLDEVPRPDLSNEMTIADMVKRFESKINDGDFSIILRISNQNLYTPGEGSGVLEWDPKGTQLYSGEKKREWFTTHPLAMLAHELGHALDASLGGLRGIREPEKQGVRMENRIREGLFLCDPTQSNLYPRPGYTARHEDLDGTSAARAWKRYIIKGRGRSVVY